MINGYEVGPLFFMGGGALKKSQPQYSTEEDATNEDEIV